MKQIWLDDKKKLDCLTFGSIVKKIQMALIKLDLDVIQFLNISKILRRSKVYERE